ncbi:MAG TPA: zinc transporter ZupT [Tessaracoccus flavescens]|uniref:Zinc transporter ZupT n=1 Tax=Tessaracoccus flavescens TaxID=399497 RepID=A0A921ERL6_9ACTN|nr:zinc transporter ZupT [Tessaracoccus flavescens]
MLFALLMSLLAGLATSVGGAIVFARSHIPRRLMAVALAFAAGAMLLVSIGEILPKGITALQDAFARPAAMAIAYTAFFVGIGLVLAIDRLLPKQLNPNETSGREGEVSDAANQRQTNSLLRSGMLVAVVLALHNFPEGMATFFTTYSDPALGMTLVTAIAIHNVPEGIAVAIPVYAATKSAKKGFWWATASGLTEPLGGLLAAGLVAWVLPEYLFGLLYGLVAGMMVFLALDELLPAAWRYQTDKHQTIYGMIGGLAVVALSLVLFSL